LTAGRTRPSGRYEQVGRVVAKLNAAVREGRDSTEILARICTSARALTGADAATVMALDPDGFFLVRASAGPATPWPLGARVWVGDSLASRALALRQPVTATVSACAYRHEKAMVDAGLRSVLYVPISAYGSANGVLGAAFQRQRIGVRGTDSGIRGTDSGIRGAGSGWEVRVVEFLAAAAALVQDAKPDERAASRERERLARDLHDSVVQTLYGISLGAGTAGELLGHDPARAQQSIAWIRDAAAAGLTDVRGLILRLRPEALANGGLTVALRQLVESTAPGGSTHGWETTVVLGPEPDVSPEIGEALYRIAQEALQNAAKHAEAGHVTLRLSTTPTGAAADGATDSVTDGVTVEVIDDGKGFTPTDEFPGGLGIRSMRERAEDAGGRFEIHSAPGQGTQIQAHLPAS
jgi:signal transduction histidine kinase